MHDPTPKSSSVRRSPLRLGQREGPQPTLLLLALGLLHAGESPLRGETLALEAAADTALIEYQPEYNLGRQSDLPAGTLGTPAGQTRTRLLVQFDLAGTLPTGARLEAATLRLTAVRVPELPNPSTFTLHRLLVPWSEGNQSGAAPGGSPARDGEPTWDAWAHPDHPWQAPGGLAGADFLAEPDAAERVVGLGVYEFELGVAGLRAMQAALDGRERHDGWMLRSQAEAVARTARRFASREHSSGGPTLVLRYRPPPVAPRILELEVYSDRQVLRFSAQSGVRYTWERRTAVATGPWIGLETLTFEGVEGETTLTNRVAPGVSGFHRLVAGWP